MLQSVPTTLPQRSKLLVAVLALLAAPAFLRAQTPDTQTVPAAPTVPAPPAREIIDETGRTVRLPLTIERIVSLAPSLTETVYALGLQDRLVGDTDFCDYPPDAQKKTKVGGALNPSLERIASLHPDVVLLTKSLNRLETVRALDTLGIASYATTDPHTVEDIVRSTAKLADILGAPDTAQPVTADMQQHLEELQSKLKSVTPSRVLFIVWTEPLISIGKDTFIADALRKAGATSVVNATQDWPHTDLEEVVRLQPEVLVFANSHSETAAHDFDVLATKPGWRLLDAVRNRRFAVISDAVNRPAPRIVSAIEDLARQLHPDAFAEPPAETPKDAPVKTTPAAPPSHKQRTAFLVEPNFAPGRELACAR